MQFNYIHINKVIYHYVYGYGYKFFVSLWQQLSKCSIYIQMSKTHEFVQCVTQLVLHSPTSLLYVGYSDMNTKA